MTNLQNDPLAAILAEYAASQQKGGDPANVGAPAPTNITLDINGNPISFSDAAHASKVVTETLTTYEKQLQQIKAENDALLSKMNEFLQQPNFGAPQSVQPENKPSIDPEEYAKLLLTDPAKADALAAEHNPVIKELKAELTKARQTQVEQQFVQRHPFYANPQAAKVIGGIMQQANLPFTSENLELAVGFAQNQGLLPNERMLAQQAQAAQTARLAQMMYSPASPQVGGYENMGQEQSPPFTPPGGFQPSPMMQYAQGMNTPPPPPSPGRAGFGGAPSSYDQLVQVADKMSADDLKKAIESLHAQGVR